MTLLLSGSLFGPILEEFKTMLSENVNHTVEPEAKTIVIVPAFNEAGSVQGVVAEILQVLPNAAVLVVNDGSADNTAQLANDAGAFVLTLPFNLGVGGAIRLGFKFARAHGYEVAVQVDADGQHDPRDIPALLSGLRNFDVVIGARFAGKGDYDLHGPRRWAMKLLSAILSSVTKTRLTDTTSGFKVNNVRAIHFFADHYPAEYLGDTVEIIVTGSRAGLRFGQVGVSMRDRFAGTPSHSPAKAMLQLFRAMLALTFALIRPAIPLQKEDSHE